MSDKLSRFTFLILFLVSPFLFAHPAFGQEASDTYTVDCNRMWIDYDVTKDNEFGMRLHVNLTVRQMKDVPSNLAFAIELENGDKVFADDPAYASTNGQLTVYRKLNQRFINSVYNDVEVFLPYREITVGAGSHNLRVHVDLLYENGGNIHVTYHDFSFTR